MMNEQPKSTVKKWREERRTVSKQRHSDNRSQYQHDYARLIHSPSFRRLQGKSQVFGAGSGDYYRTRLTHTLEVAEIARDLALRLVKDLRHRGTDTSVNFAAHPGLWIDPLVVECAAIAHDLGHPPFGHKGEADLNTIVSTLKSGPAQRFEGNAQNFRLIIFLEKRLEWVRGLGSGQGDPIDGLNLTAAVLLATNKYPRLLPVDNYNIKKGLYLSEWSYIDELRNRWCIPSGCTTIEAQIMDMSDDIAYASHDLEDGIRAGKINTDTVLSHPIIDAVIEEIDRDSKAGKIDPPLFNDDAELRKDVEMVLERFGAHWHDLLKETKAQQAQDSARARRALTGDLVSEFSSAVGILPQSTWPKVTFVKDGTQDTELRKKMIILKRLAYVTLVRDFRVQRLQQRGEKVIRGLWEALYSMDPLSPKGSGFSLIPQDWVRRYTNDPIEWPWERVVVDYIAGMTDAYADRLYGELYGRGVAGSIYDPD